MSWTFSSFLLREEILQPAESNRGRTIKRGRFSRSVQACWGSNYSTAIWILVEERFHTRTQRHAHASASPWPLSGSVWGEKEDRRRWISSRLGSALQTGSRGVRVRTQVRHRSLHLARSKGVSLVKTFDSGDRRGVCEVVFALKYWSSGLQGASSSLTLLSRIKRSSMMAPGSVSPSRCLFL